MLAVPAGRRANPIELETTIYMTVTASVFLGELLTRSRFHTDIVSIFFGG
jgi:hypothetical protein